MSREEWIKFIASNPKSDRFVFQYCVHKGKDEELSRLFCSIVLAAGGFSCPTMDQLMDRAYERLREEFNFTELRDREGRLIKVY